CGLWPYPGLRVTLFAERSRHERRQFQRRMMDVGAVVERLETLGARIDLAEVEVARLLRQRAAPPAGWIARLREGQRLERGEAGLAHLAAHFPDQVQQHQRRFGLLHEDAVVAQGAEAAFVEGLVE